MRIEPFSLDMIPWWWRLAARLHIARLLPIRARITAVRCRHCGEWNDIGRPWDEEDRRRLGIPESTVSP